MWLSHEHVSEEQVSPVEGLNVNERKVAQVLHSLSMSFHHSGMPDFLIDTGQGLIFVEVKCGKDKIRPNQEKFHETLRKYGHKVFVFYMHPEESTTKIKERLKRFFHNAGQSQSSLI